MGWRPRIVSFSAGGIRIIGHLGVLTQLLETDVLSDVRAWYGCSGGAVCAYFGALGVTAGWLREAIQHFDTRPIPDIREEYISDFFTHWGINSGESYVAYIGRFIDTWEPGASAWTFADFAAARPGIMLGVTAVNVSQRRLELFSAATTPTVRIMDAIQASGAIPFFFKPWIGPTGDVYCDGALLEYYPWSMIPEKDATLVIITEEANLSGRFRTTEKLSTISDYCRSLWYTVSHTPSHQTPRNWIAINNHSVSMLDFHITKEVRLDLFNTGARVAKGWLEFRQRQLDASGGTAGSRPQCGDHHTLSSGCPLPDRMSDSQKSQNPRSLPSPSPHRRTPGQRRWSL